MWNARMTTIGLRKRLIKQKVIKYIHNNNSLSELIQFYYSITKYFMPPPHKILYNDMRAYT